MSDVIGGEGGTSASADSRPLTGQEYQLLQRLLSDPLSFPLEFKSWLVSYLETSDLTLPMNAILGLQTTLGISGAGQGTLGIFPAGMIFPYGGAAPPTGALLCDGTAYPRTTEARLYNAIGTAYGAPDANSFNVPDLRGRVAVGRGTHPDVANLGENEGLGVNSRSVLHGHGATLQGSSDGSTSTEPPGGFLVLTDHNPDLPVYPPSGTNRPIDAPAFTVVNFIIVR